MVDGGGDGAYLGTHNRGGHTTYGGQGGGFVGTLATNSLGSSCGLTIAGAGWSVAATLA